MSDIFQTLLQPAPTGHIPLVDATAWLHPTAQLIGNVRIGADVLVCANTVIRADETAPDGEVSPVEVGPGSNVQDGVIIHSLAGASAIVGTGCSLAHGCIVHGPCTISDGCFIGFRAVLFGCLLGEGVMVSAGAVVQDVTLPAGVFVPPGAAIISESDVADLRQVSKEERDLLNAIATENQDLLAGYRKTYGA